MPNQINRDIYVLSSKVKDPIDYVRLTNDIPIVFTFRDYDIPSGSTAQVYVQKPSGKAVYDTAAISGNVVTVTVTDQMFAELGVSDMQIRLTQGDEKLVSFSQPVRVHPNYTEGDAQQSQNEGGFFDDAEQAVENANKAVSNANAAIENLNEQIASLNNNFATLAQTVSISQLQTTAKNLVGAVNELNSNYFQPLVESVSVITSKIIDSSSYASNILVGEYPEGFTRSNCIPIAVGGLRGDNRWFFGFRDNSYQEQYAVELEDDGVYVYRFAEDASNVNGSSVSIYVYLLKYTD